MITQNSHEEALTHRGCGDGPPPKVTSVLSRRANLEAQMGADAGLGEDRVLGTQSDPDSELDAAAPAPLAWSICCSLGTAAKDTVLRSDRAPEALPSAESAPGETSIRRHHPAPCRQLQGTQLPSIKPLRSFAKM